METQLFKTGDNWLFFCGLPYSLASIIKELTDLGFPKEIDRQKSRYPSGQTEDVSEVAFIQQQRLMRDVANALKSFHNVSATVVNDTGTKRSYVMNMNDVKVIKVSGYHLLHAFI